MLRAVIGIGSNSTRLLVGRSGSGAVTPVLRLREGTRLFSGLSQGRLSPASMAWTANAVNRLVRRARELGVQSLHIFATSAVRDAENAGEFRELVETLCGVPPQILTGEEEARLSFAGCAEKGFCGVVDIGGGSTEIAVGGGGRPLRAGTAQLGAVRLLTEIGDLDGDGLTRALALSAERAGAVWAKTRQGETPAAWFGVGGTFTALAALDMGLAEYDRDAVEGHALRRSSLEGWAQRLAAMPLRERAALPGLPMGRADIIGHGAALLLGVMEALGIRRIVVSTRTNLDGYLSELAALEEDADWTQKIRAYYDASVEREWERLEEGFFEFEINKRYIDRYVRPGDRVLDVGGGPGRYSLYLAGRGADVTLVDLSPANVAFAREKAREAGLPLRAVCGDARELDAAAEGDYDAILLMGPLYHLLREADRVRAVEACLGRLTPGGVFVAAFLSTVAGLVYAARSLPESILWEGEDAFYEKLIAGEDFAGAGFTQVYMAAPDSILPFMARFPLETLHLAVSEGVTAPFAQSLAGQPPEVTAKWLALSLALCERKDFRSYGEHFLYVGRKKEEPV